MQSKSCVQFKIKLHIKYHPYIKILVPLDRTSTKILIKSICNLQVVVLLRRNILHGPANYKVSLSTVIIYKEMFLGCDWLIRVQLIQNITQNSAKICNNSAKICNNSTKICNKLFELTRACLSVIALEIILLPIRICLCSLTPFTVNMIH